MFSQEGSDPERTLDGLGWVPSLEKARQEKVQESEAMVTTLWFLLPRLHLRRWWEPHTGSRIPGEAHFVISVVRKGSCQVAGGCHRSHKAVSGLPYGQMVRKLCEF